MPLPVIASLAAFALQQSGPTPVVTSSYTPPADLPASVTRAVQGCLASQIFLETRPDVREASPLRSTDAQDGSVLRYRTARGACQITASTWSPRGEVMARAVEAGLTALSPSPAVVQWRAPVLSEHGPTVRTTFERRNPDGRTIGVVRLVEPADNTTGEVSVIYQAVQP